MSDTPPPGEPARILLVEDDLDQAHLLKFLLEDEGKYVVTLAQDGLRGSALVREEEWDLVITDLNLPGAHGMTVVEAARRHHPNLPVLATTGYSGPEYAKRAREEGADDVLLKPLDRDDLLLRVETLLSVSDRPRPPAPPPEAEAEEDLLRVLALSVRPGDAEAGCGGALLKHRDRGDRVVLLTLSHGAEGPAGEARRDEAKAAGRKLGLRFFVGNAGSGETPLEEDLARLVGGALKEIRPDILYLPTPHHPDPSFRTVYDTVLGQDALPEAIFAFDAGDGGPEFHPDVFIPLDDLVDRKVEALASFSPDGAEHLAEDRIVTSGRFWGRHVEEEAAEALERVRGTRDPFSDPPSGD